MEKTVNRVDFLKFKLPDSGVSGIIASALDKVEILFMPPDLLCSVSPVSGEEDEVVHGFTDLSKNIIYINNSLSIDMQRRAVCHELMEWGNAIYGLELEHIQISVLGQFLYSLLAD